ncbi:2,3-oxidosqualene cyclase [Stigmatella aurantiaca]|uniref:Cycloartenol synthase n=2 Tax=Stigmatella aurantiaca (strain DW4/3-1) TaxID=378806 RepID=E3FPJ3_STIAD|nr:2,3-oxidosqualene cyclase [Stigmatella aurantiaca]ADO73188.1 Cycloartenol synthase [Stigmatella aurantiaca DW4/3-1]
MSVAAGERLPQSVSVIQRGLDVLAATQDTEGSWYGDYGGPQFLIPIYVAGLHVMGRTPEPEQRDGLIAYLRNHQNADGGWGLDVEAPSQVFTSVLNYVALRLLGVGKDDAGLRRARQWFLPRGGPLGSGAWGKIILALLGLYEYGGLQPVPPELWLLPESLPFHPSRLWCHCRMVYLPMSWLYGRRARAPETPLLAAIRQEIFDGGYGQVDWVAARERVSPTDVFTPRTFWLKAANQVMYGYERLAGKQLRARALDFALEQIRAEDEATHYICIGPINKVLNMVVWHFVNPDGPEVRAHLERLPDYFYEGDDGVRMNGYNSSELWDTAFAVQAVAATGETGRHRRMLEEAARFIEANQVLEDTREPQRFFRHPSKGGWPFSTRDHGWPISDCTAEGLKASLVLEPLGLNRVPQARLQDAVQLILSMQNEDGGWATYELQRGPKVLELLNPSDVFSTIMVDVSYVECTSACVQALAAWRKHHPVPDARVDRAISRGVEFIRRTQREDGSWMGSWGVCFTYGTWFGVMGLIAAGASPDDMALRRATAFLRSYQRADGAWSEVVESCRQARWVEGKQGHAVNTSWALLTLAAAGEGGSDAAQRGVRWLRERQQEDGRWPPEPIAGIFNRTCAIHYDAYLRIFPVWALAVCDKR